MDTKLIPYIEMAIFFLPFFLLVRKFGVQDSISAFFYRLLEAGHSYIMYVWMVALCAPMVWVVATVTLPVGTSISFLLACVGLLFGVGVAGNYKDREKKSASFFRKLFGTDMVHYIGSVAAIGGFLIGLAFAGLWFPMITFAMLAASVGLVKDFPNRTTWVEVFGFVTIATGLIYLLKI